MTKEIRICNCGRIHFVDQDIIHAALDEDKNVLFICGGCGRATIIGADRERDWLEETDKEIFNMYSYEAGNKDFIVDPTNFENAERTKGIYRIIYSKGKQVRMETGMNANSFFNGEFLDSWYPDFYKIERKDITVPEIMQFIDDWRKERQTVMMHSLLRELTDDEASLLARCCYVKNLDWTGTKYENVASL